MIDDNRLQEGTGVRLRLLCLDPPVLFARELSSTSDALKVLLKKNPVTPWTALVCGLQTKGRGRPGNCWISRRGDLTTSQWLEKGSFPLPLRLPLSLFVASACLRVLADLGFGSVFWKYPNDLYASHGGREGKIGGILVEPAGDREEGPDGKKTGPSVSGWISGVGLNLSSWKKDESGFSGADQFREVHESGRMSLSDPAVRKNGQRVPGPLFLSVVLARALRESVQFRSEEEVRGHLEDRLLWKKRWVVYSLSGRNGLGRIEGLGPRGELLAIDPAGRTVILGPHVRNLRVLGK